MSNISTYLANALLDHAFGEAAYAEPSCYLALFTTVPSMPAGTGGVEVVGGSYARVALSAKMAAAAAGAIASNANAVFPTATADWGLIVGVGIYDASSAGNLLYAGPLTQSKNVYNGDTYQINSGALAASLS